MKKIKNFLFLIILFFCLINYISSSLKFNIPHHKDKCFQQEIYYEGALLIRYDLTGFERDFPQNRQQDLFKNIKIFVKDEKGNNIYETDLKSRKDKFVVLIKNQGTYQICTRYFKPNRERALSTNILMGIKIRNDYDYKKIDDTLHKEDVDNFWKKIREIRKEMRPSIEASKLELKEEDRTAKSIISSINTYYILCCFQLAIIIIVTIITIVSYQEYFKNKSII